MELFNDKILKLVNFHTIFSDLLSTSFDDWFKAISYFKSEFVTAPMTEKFEYFSKSELKISNAEHFYLTGFDMPCWVSDVNPVKRIMILASEPLRNENSWSKNHDRYKNISINTPFSYHRSKIEPDRLENFRYWILINWMASQLNATVYMTDIRKFWFAGWEHYNEFNNSEIHINVFKKELDFINPDLIIIFGSRPLNILQSEKLLDLEINLTKNRLPVNGFKIKNLEGYKVLPLIHPSGAAGGPRKKFFEVNNVSGENQNEMYKEIIKRFVN
mgnify:FL=1